MPVARHYLGAMRKGYLAYLAHQAETACPYKDTRNQFGRITYCRSWKRAWLYGFTLARQDQQAGDYRGWFPERVI